MTSAKPPSDSGEGNQIGDSPNCYQSLHPITNGNKCRDSWPSTELSASNSVEEKEKELYKPGMSNIITKQKQLTWDHRSLYGPTAREPTLDRTKP